MKYEHVQALDVYAAELFDDPAFLAWLNRMTGKGLATWHTGGEPGEYSDVFVVYDQGEGPESPENGDDGMPEHCWDKIDRLCKELLFTYGFIRLINDEGRDSLGAINVPGDN